MEGEDRIDRIRGRKETAARLRISTRTLRRLEVSGEIKATRVTDRVVGYRDSEIEKFLDRRTGLA